MVIRSGDKFLGGIWVYSQPILFLEEVKKKGSRENLLSFFMTKNLDEIRLKNLFKKFLKKVLTNRKFSVIL